jgi:hypothetical protein
VLPSLHSLFAVLVHEGIAVLDDVELDAVPLRERDPWLGALADGKDVRHARGKAVADCILNVDNLERARMLLTIHNGSHTTHVVPTTDHDSAASLELHMIKDFACCNVKADGVAGFDIRVGESEGAAIVGHAIWRALWSPQDPLHAAQLVGGLLLLHFVQDELALCVVEQAEVLLRGCVPVEQTSR